jgi:hypothetical protein
MPSPKSLIIRAGPLAARRLREEGFHPDLFTTLVGASGGPKWLVLRALDDFWADRLVEGRSHPIDAVGSSIGSFRHACLGQSDPKAALERFAEGYVEQRYADRKPDPDTITRESSRILDQMLGEKGADEVARNEMFRSHIIAARLRTQRGIDRGLALQLRLAVAACANAFSRRTLGRFFERGVFGPAQSAIRFSDYPTLTQTLDAASVSEALVASGSIPGLMAGVPNVGEAEGMWFDGGILDYHFDFEFERQKGLVLFPHFFDRITPGWFDKPLPWRRPTARALDDVVMVAPRDEFVAALPGAHVPDRNDFIELATDDRIRQWRAVLERCESLVDELCDLVDGGGLADAIQPFPGAA